MYNIADCGHDGKARWCCHGLCSPPLWSHGGGWLAPHRHTVTVLRELHALCSCSWVREALVSAGINLFPFDLDVVRQDDADDDGDDVDDVLDAFPLEICASSDRDLDGMPDQLTVPGCPTSLLADSDDDNDGVLDADDVDPLDPDVGAIQMETVSQIGLPVMPPRDTIRTQMMTTTACWMSMMYSHSCQQSP